LNKEIHKRKNSNILEVEVIDIRIKILDLNIIRLSRKERESSSRNTRIRSRFVQGVVAI